MAAVVRRVVSAGQAEAVIPPADGSAIATLPPLPEPSQRGYPLSPITGQPRRPAGLAVVGLVFACHIIGIVWCFASFWWLAASVSQLDRANRLFAWAKPDPVSATAVGLVIATAGLAVAGVACWGSIIYNAWQGRRWVRWGVVFGLAASAVLRYLQIDVLSFGLFSHWPGFVHALVWPVFLIGCGLTLAATVWLWLPGFRRFCQAMAEPRPATGRLPINRSPVVYGPQRLIGN